MGKGSTRSATPDLFPTASIRERAKPSVATPPAFPPTSSNAAAKSSSLRHVLPKDLPNAIKRLEDQDLDRLLAAALAEQKRRGRKPFVTEENSHKRRVEAVTVSLTQGKLNAVRAAFKAGVKPSQIARQFGISQSDVRRALAGDASAKNS